MSCTAHTIIDSLDFDRELACVDAATRGLHGFIRGYKGATRVYKRVTVGFVDSLDFDRELPCVLDTVGVEQRQFVHLGGCPLR